MVQPIPFYIRSGDIVIMSEACRLSYHAVPKIIASSYVIDDIQQQNKNTDCLKTFENALCMEVSSMMHATRVVVDNSAIESTVEELNYKHYDCRSSEVANDDCNDFDWLEAQKYLCSSRINVNVRQVFPSKG